MLLSTIIRRTIPTLRKNVTQMHPKTLRTLTLTSQEICPPTHNLNMTVKRHKSKKKPTKTRHSDSESSKETESEGETLDRHSKVIRAGIPSLRMDAVLKSGLGMARNKIDILFYESKIRINGEKILKKSVSVKEGDEIDIIKGVDMKNPDWLVVARVEVLKVEPASENFKVKLRRCKSLTVENYKDGYSGGPEIP